MKKKSDWSSGDMLKANANGKALNVFFGGVDENHFKFENLKIKEEEIITVFNSKLMDIANQASQLDEARDMTTMRLDELMGSLQAYEMNLNPGIREEDVSLKVEATRPKGLNFSAFASPVTTSIATSGETVCEEASGNDLLHGYELMLNKLDEMFIQNKKLAKELKECQEKLNNAEKAINNMNKGKSKIEEVPFQTRVTQHHIKETSGGDKSFLMNYKECPIGHVTFGDGQKGQVVGKGTLMVLGYKRLKNILHVEGLKANLLSISQLCDRNLVVKFTQDRCVVYDEAELGHPNFRNLMKITEMKAVKECPSLQKRKMVYVDLVNWESKVTLLTKWYTWVDFLKEKSETFEAFKKLCMQLQNEKECQIGKIVRIRSDHRREFENAQFVKFSKEYGIHHEFSTPKNPQQNRVVERKNRTLQEMARVMLNSKKLSTRFWAEAINTACYIINRVYIRPSTNMKLDQLGKFDRKSDEGLFMGYFTTSRAYRVFNSKTKKTQGASSEPNKLITQNCESADEELQEVQEVATQVTTPTTTTEIAQDSDKQQVITDVATEVTTDKIISGSDKEEIDDEEDNEDSSLEASSIIKKNHPI
ncbi:uncharacterized protein LOC120281117 [Dioscorea cayenensis subsp. rotundata]|uniref:Uncharacterized protein LOC120281117 n=1 Tax=Dioscorea cayennensis subsp. rotundata TaxID=55577 RepID=A0AB40D146_DIOCR|nr:uncharacterized protein LOC120281117 [Dioscorea cayenensis subsp. rotundata]